MQANLKERNPRVTAIVVASTALVALLVLVMAALPQSALAATCSVRYTVTSGDTLSKIGETYKVTVDELIAANELKAPYTITVGQSLCIPGSATQPTTTADAKASTKPAFSASRQANLLTIDIKNYPSRAIYYVRIDNDLPVGYRNYALGRVRTNRSGAVTAYFRIPKKLADTSLITVCIKNAVNDNADCVNVYNNLR